MEVQQDFKDLLELLNQNKVDYIIVGAYALAYHGVPRFTGDIDILVRPETDNARRVISTLSDFGFGELDLTEDDFTTQETVIQLGVPPVRIDFLTSITGVTWEDAASGKVLGTYSDVPVYYLGKSHYIANKKATGRLKDLADIEALGEK